MDSANLEGQFTFRSYSFLDDVFKCDEFHDVIQLPDDTSCLWLYCRSAALLTLCCLHASFDVTNLDGYQCWSHRVRPLSCDKIVWT